MEEFHIKSFKILNLSKYDEIMIYNIKFKSIYLIINYLKLNFQLEFKLELKVVNI